MQSKYKPLGKYIREVNDRNTNEGVSTLLGVNINKYFMPSVANVVGTDMSKYKVVKKGHFACNRMHVGRDKRLPVALSTREGPFLVSPAYDVFEIKDEDQLDTEYLMMWFSRKEFDRNAWFYTDADVRGGLNWNAFCELTLPVPPIEKQKEIVAEYNIIVNRIKLNEQINKKLEETAQVIYKQWFVDFEFPDENGKPYKSSGGEMAYDSIMKIELPKQWQNCPIQQLIDDEIIENNQDGNHGEIHPKSDDYVAEGIPFIMANDIKNGILDLSNCKYIAKSQADKLRIGFSLNGDVLITHKGTMGRTAIVENVDEYIVLTPQVTYYRIKDIEMMNQEYLYCFFNSENFQNIFNSESEQSTRKFLSITNQRLLNFLLPTDTVLNKFCNILKPLLQQRRIRAREILCLEKLMNVLTTKMTKNIEGEIH